MTGLYSIIPTKANGCVAKNGNIRSTESIVVPSPNYVYKRPATAPPHSV